MYSRFGRAATTTKTTTTTKLKAKNPENQPGLDKLVEVYDRASSNPNSNYVFTVRRAMKSLQNCATAITTQKEACELKFVGQSIAKIICPTFLPSPTNSAAAVASTMARRNNNNNNNPRKRTRVTKAASAPIEQGPTKKEKIYQQERLAAESLDLSNNNSNKFGPWKVILLIDWREHKSQHVVSKIKQAGIPCEERHLPIGDMAWIAQAQDKITGRTMEVLCGTIIERKETSDLVGSLFGTRYLEQRMRLKSCGVPQLLFLVEGHLGANVNCPQETLEMAIMETRCLGFHVLQTENLQETVKKLKGFHRRILQRTFPEAFSHLPTYTRSPTGTFGLHRKRRPSSLLEMTFDTPPKPALGAKRFITFTELKAKVELDREEGTRTVGAIYMAMLKQIPTLSDKKCEALAKMYPTMNALMTAYATSDDPSKLVQDVPLGRQKMGPKSSQAVYTTCCTQRDGFRPNGPTMDFVDSPVATTTTTTATGGPLDAFFAPSPPKAASTINNTTNTTPSSSSAIVGKNAESKPYFSPPSPQRKPASTTTECVDLTADTPPRPTAAAMKKNPSYFLDPPTTSGSPGCSLASGGGGAGKSNNTYKYTKATPKTAKMTSVHLDFSSPLFSSPDDDSLLYSAPTFAKRTKTTGLDNALAKSFDTSTTSSSTPSPTLRQGSKKPSPPVSAKKQPDILVIDSSDDDEGDYDDELFQKKNKKPSAVAARAAATASSYLPSASPPTIRRVSDGSSTTTTTSSSSSSSSTSSGRALLKRAAPATTTSSTVNVTMRTTRTTTAPWQNALDSDDTSDSDDDLGVSLDLKSRLAKRAKITETIVID